MNLPILVWLLLATIWGSTWLFIKIGLENLPPFTFACARFCVALIPLSVLTLIRRSPFPKNLKDWVLILITSLLTISLNYGLVFWGENFISSGLTAILYSTFPLFGMIIAHFYLSSEPITLKKLSGIFIGITGVIIIFSNQVSVNSEIALWGCGAILLASLGTAFANILIKAHGLHFDPLFLTFSQIAIGLIPLSLVALKLEGSPLQHCWTAKAWIAVAYLAFIGSALPFVLYYWLLQRMEVTKTQLIPLASTLIAVTLGILILEEKLSLRVGVGAVAILGGLVLTTLGFKKAKN